MGPAIEKLVTPKSEKKKIGKNTSPSEGKTVELSDTTEFEPIPSTSKVDPYAKETTTVPKPEEVKPKLEITEKSTPKEETTQSSNDEVVVVDEVETKKPDLSLALVSAKQKFNEKEEVEKIEVSDKL